MGFDVGDSSSEEDGENPNEPPGDGIPPQGSTAPRRGAGGARGRRRGPWGGSQTVAAKGTKRKWDKTSTWAAVENSIGIMRNLTKAELDTMLLQIPATTRHDQVAIPGSQGYMIVWAQTHPGAIIHLCYTIAITLSKI